MNRYGGRFITVLGVALVLGVSLPSEADAGLIWNVDGEEKTEKASSSTAVSFLRGASEIYNVLGSLEEGKYDKDAAGRASTALGNAVKGCQDLAKLGEQDAKVEKRLADVAALAGARKREHEEVQKTIPVQEVVVWQLVSRVLARVRQEPKQSVSDTLKQCSDAVGPVAAAFSAMRKSIEGGATPPLIERWRLMNLIERAFVTGRYISIIMLPPQ